MRISDWSSDVCSSDLLTGKYQPGKAPPKGSRAGRKDRRMLESEFRPESLAIAQKIKAHAEAKGMTAADFAINWVLANPIVTALLAGPRTLDLWKGYLSALDHGFDRSEEHTSDLQSLMRISYAVFCLHQKNNTIRSLVIL